MVADKKFRLARICSTLSYGKPTIHMWGYDESGNPVYRYDSYYDYYYILDGKQEVLSRFKTQTPNSDKKYPSVFGETVVKVKSTSVRDKKTVTELAGNFTYEADVPIDIKYLLENGVQWSDHRHVAFFDIETMPDENPDGTASFSSADNPHAPITSIQIWSSVMNRGFVFTWHPVHTAHADTPILKEKEKCTYVFCKDEVDVILAFCEFLKTYSVDVISGWYSSGFDLPYIMNRCKLLGLDPGIMSPVGLSKIYKSKNNWRAYVNGLDHIDMLEAIQDLGYNLSNYKLATAAKEILENPDMEKLTHATWKDWKDNYKGFLDYALRDVEILSEIDSALGIFSLYISLQKTANLPTLGHVMMKSMIVDFYLLSEYHGKVIFPTRITKKKRKYAGAIVIDPTEPGLHKNVAVVDYTSLYPTSIMAFNISPETFIASEEDLENSGRDSSKLVNRLNEKGIPFVDTGRDNTLFGKRYFFYAQKHKVGILPKALKTLFLQRKEINANLAAGKYKGKNKVAMEKKQIAIKLILNSAYGAMGFPYFRLYKPECADAITYFAREALKYALASLNADGHTVLYADTDSAFFKENGKSVEEILDWLSKFDGKLSNEFIPMYNNGCLDEWKLLDLKFEKDMERIYFGGSKKRYYGIVRDTGKKYIRGMNIIRKDAPKFIKQELNALAEACVMETVTVDHLLALREKMRGADLLELGVVKNFTRPFHEYTTKVQHVRGAEFAMNHLGVEISYVDNPYMFYIRSKCQNDLKPNERDKVICLNEEDLHLVSERPDVFEIDWDVYYRKQVLDQLEEFEHIPAVKIALAEYEERI